MEYVKLPITTEFTGVRLKLQVSPVEVSVGRIPDSFVGMSQFQNGDKEQKKIGGKIIMIPNWKVFVT